MEKFQHYTCDKRLSKLYVCLGLNTRLTMLVGKGLVRHGYGRSAKVSVNDSGRTDTVCCCCSVAKSCLTLRPHGLQHTRPPCPSLSPGVCPGLCPLSR